MYCWRVFFVLFEFFSPVTEDFDCHNFSTSNNTYSLRTLGHICSFSTDVCRFRFSGGLKPNLLLNGRDLVFPVPALRLRDLRDVGSVVSENSPAFSILVATWFPVLFIWEWVSGYIFQFLTFLTSVPVEALPSVLQIPWVIPNSKCALPFLIPS